MVWQKTYFLFDVLGWFPDSREELECPWCKDNPQSNRLWTRGAWTGCAWRWSCWGRRDTGRLPVHDLPLAWNEAYVWCGKDMTALQQGWFEWWVGRWFSGHVAQGRWVCTRWHEWREGVGFQGWWRWTNPCWPRTNTRPWDQFGKEDAAKNAYLVDEWNGRRHCFSNRQWHVWPFRWEWVHVVLEGWPRRSSRPNRPRPHRSSVRSRCCRYCYWFHHRLRRGSVRIGNWFRGLFWNSVCVEISHNMAWPDIAWWTECLNPIERWNICLERVAILVPFPANADSVWCPWFQWERMGKVRSFK